MVVDSLLLQLFGPCCVVQCLASFFYFTIISTRKRELLAVLLFCFSSAKSLYLFTTTTKAVINLSSDAVLISVLLLKLQLNP